MGIKLTDPSNPERKTGVWYKHLYAQVLIAIMAGIALGYFAPSVGTAMKPLGDAFIRLVKMVIAPVIFLTVVTGIAGMRELSGVGRVAARAFVYFITVSTFALFIGLVVANLVKPGHGMNIDPTSIDDAGVADYVQKAHDSSITGFLTDIIPTTLVAAVADGHILQVLFVAILFGVSLTMIGEKARPLIELFDAATHAVFKLVSILMHAAPIGAFGAMAFMIGTYGVGTLTNLMGLVLTFYATSLLFVLVVLGLIARAAGFRILRLIAYLKSELLLVLGTSSSEAALPSLIEKMERAGCEKSVVGLVVPTGYSFNLDGTNIYMTLAALFVAQALNIELAFQDQIALLLVAMISSKGAAGVTGAGFITLAATLSIVPTVPVAGMALILGIDRFMSECRSLTNFIGNAVATIVVSAWEGKLDRSRLNAAMAGIPLPPTSDVETIIED